MENEQTKTIEALHLAIQMEVDGKAYYLRASQNSNHKIGKNLFHWLAGEEEKHQLKFEEIYRTIESKRDWPKVNIQSLKGKGTKTLFAEAIDAVESHLETFQEELDAVAKAISMENKTHDFYRIRSQIATSVAEKEFYEVLAAEEKGHYLALIDYREYLLDPAGWFRKTERHSLDGV